MIRLGTLGAILNVTQGGLVVYGSLIGALLGGLWFLRRHALPTLAVADLMAPSLVLGLALGRIGCLLNGCCYGGLCDAPWGLTFPAESEPYKHQQSLGQLHGFQIAEDSARHGSSRGRRRAGWSGRRGRLEIRGRLDGD